MTHPTQALIGASQHRSMLLWARSALVAMGIVLLIGETMLQLQLPLLEWLTHQLATNYFPLLSLNVDADPALIAMRAVITRDIPLNSRQFIPVGATLNAGVYALNVQATWAIIVTFSLVRVLGFESRKVLRLQFLLKQVGLVMTGILIISALTVPLFLAASFELLLEESRDALHATQNRPWLLYLNYFMQAGGGFALATGLSLLFYWTTLSARKS